MLRRKAQSGYLIAEPSGFPGVRIPLLSDEECRARGVEPGRLPPRETWTQKQRDAADKLAEIFIPHVFLEALRVILAELERVPLDPAIPDTEHEKVAAQRGIELVNAGKWKQQDTWVHFPPSWIREMLELFVRGELSICDPEGASKRRTKQRSGARTRGRARERASDDAGSKRTEKPRYRLVDGKWREVTSGTETMARKRREARAGPSANGCSDTWPD